MVGVTLKRHPEILKLMTIETMQPIAGNHPDEPVGILNNFTHHTLPKALLQAIGVHKNCFFRQKALAGKGIEKEEKNQRKP
jgi:hypothetical protein